MRISDKYALIIVAGLTSGVGAASVNIAARFTSDTGDVLGFFGGAIGAGSAVFGSMWLERFKSRENEKVERKKLKRDVVRFGKLCRSYLEHPNDITILGKALSLRQSWTSVVKRHGTSHSLDGQFLAPIDTISYWHEAAIKCIDELVISANANPSNIDVSRINLDKYAKAMHLLIYHLLTQEDEWGSEDALSIGDPAVISEQAK